MTKPVRFWLPMLLFLAAIAGVVYLLFDPLKRVFQTNPVLNAAILLVLWVGVLHVFNRVLRLAPEIRWVEVRKRRESSLVMEAMPTLLAPMAAMLGDEHRPSLSASSTTSLLDSVGARLEESREISRYLIGLLIFLGLLGTFWGLLDTVGSVSDVIKSLALTSGDVTKLFADLQAGLRAPLSGMGTAFGSSLFGLSGSLVLGFLDLMAGQSQNRFYNELEEWLAGLTQLSPGGDMDASPEFLRGMVQQTADRLDNVARALATVETGRARIEAALGTLADRLGSVAERFGQQEQLTRALAERQVALEPILQRLGMPVEPAPDAIASAGLEHLRGIELTLGRLVEVVEAAPSAQVPAIPPPPAAVAAAPMPGEIDLRALTHLENLDTLMRRLIALTEARPEPAVPGVPATPAALLDPQAAAQLKSLDTSLHRLIAVMEAAAVMPPGRQSPSRQPAPEAERQVVAHLRSLDDTMRQLLELTAAARAGAPASSDPAPEAVAHLRSLDETMRRLLALTEAAHGGMPAPTDVAPEAVAHLRSLDDTMRQLLELTEAARGAAPAPSDAAPEAVAHLRSLDETMRRLLAATEAGRPAGQDEAARRHLASIDAALQRLAALGAVAAASGDGRSAIDDGAALAHLASIEQHLQHIAREAGQLQHRVAQEVRGELRNLAQSLATFAADEPPVHPEP